ncbi:MAG: DUF5671 domain-containing protein [Candidatus Moranbacteria bacterium]|nr:DUF5671 domain-containing protein [Candidatus Moranbacteria bacterium]
MEAPILSEYVVSRIRTGIAKAEIKEELVAVGWTEEEIEAAYRSAMVAFGAPVPSAGNRPTLAHKAATVDVVINFFSFILLGIVASALGTLFFQIINISFPDVLDVAGSFSLGQATSSIHYAIAALFIGFPLYFFAMRLWFRKFREDEGRTESALSKWLTYLVLLVAAVTIVGDLITVVFTMLQGEVTVRFFLKALTILTIAGAIFGFYYLERRKVQYHADITRSTFQNFGRGVMTLIVTGIVLGFFVGGSPTTERNRALDQARVGHLGGLASCIKQYAQSFGALPVTLGDLRQSSQYNYCASYMRDPETGESYEYRIVTPSRVAGAGQVGEFELCATFASPSAGVTAASEPMYGATSLWDEHDAGYNCDTVTAQLLAPSAPNVPEKPVAPVSPVMIE